MDIRQCERCSKLFQYRGNRNCPACVQELDEIFLNVRNFLDENPQSDVEDVCEHCGADEDDVLRWLREGRLIRSTESVPLLKCQLCRRAIKNGRYCDACALKVLGQLENTAQHLGSRAGGGSGAGRKKGYEEDKRIHLRISEER